MPDPKSEPGLPEPWLRGTMRDLPAVLTAILDALQLAAEDIDRWCARLTEAEIHARPSGLPSVAFHIRHIARSMDRLLTYAEGHQLTSQQLAALKSEMDSHGSPQSIREEFQSSLENIAARIHAFKSISLELPRSVGRKSLPSTVGGLLVHIADHTQRHTGQTVTTAKLLLATRPNRFGA
jgi:uncharacterized damage-inducible protein DinB